MVLRIIMIIGIVLLYFSACSQFKEGYVIDNYGEKYSGLISGSGGEYISYKETRTSLKERLSVKDIKAYGIGDKNFIAVKDYQVPLTKIVLNSFGKVILKGANTQIVCLVTVVEYKTMPNGLVTSKDVDYYLIYRDNKFTSLTDYNFVHEMKLIVADDQRLIQRITSKELTLKQLNKIADIYSQKI